MGPSDFGAPLGTRGVKRKKTLAVGQNSSQCARCAADTLVTALGGCNNLEDLDISGCNIYSRSMVDLFRAIPQSPKLTDLVVDYNNGHAAAAEVLLTVILKLENQRLDINLSYNEIGHEMRSKLMELEEARPSSLIDIEMGHDGEDAAPESEKDGSEGDGGDGGY